MTAALHEPGKGEIGDSFAHGEPAMALDAPGPNPGLGKSAALAPRIVPPSNSVAEIVAEANGDTAAPPRILPDGAVHTAARRGPPPLKLLKKLADIMADLDWVEKRGHNAHFNYDYATESDILAAIRPRLSEVGIFVQTIVEAESATPTGKESSGGAKMMRHRVQLLHVFYDSESGETLEGVGIGYSNDDSDKGFYKAYTGAVKYFFTKTFLVSSGDDPENMNPEERAAAKKANKEKQQQAAPARGPQQTPGSVQTDENGVFPVVTLVDQWTTKALSNNRTQWSFVIPNVGKASTINKVLAEKVMKEKGTGMPVRFYLKRAGSFLNLENAEVLPPGSQS